MQKIRYVTDKQGKKTGVYLSYTRYRRMLEDLHDLKVVAERRSEKPTSLKAFKTRLRKKGLV